MQHIFLLFLQLYMKITHLYQKDPTTKAEMISSSHATSNLKGLWYWRRIDIRQIEWLTHYAKPSNDQINCQLSRFVCTVSQFGSNVTNYETITNKQLGGESISTYLKWKLPAANFVSLISLILLSATYICLYYWYCQKYTTYLSFIQLNEPFH
jgi:hypothetical protein